MVKNGYAFATYAGSLEHFSDFRYYENRRGTKIAACGIQKYVRIKPNMEDKNIYDLVIIGAGCAGASGAMYAARMNLRTVMIAELPGGLITTTHLVENWPGIKNISGPDLGCALLDHAVSFGVPLMNERVVEVKKAVSEPPAGKQSGYIVKTASNSYYAKTVLFATGTKHKTLDVPGEKEFTNKGLSYCALCDGAFFKGKPVALVGSGDSAPKEALLLGKYCGNYFLVRKDG